MEQQRPQEFILEAFADPASVRDVVRGTTPNTNLLAPLNAPHLTMLGDDQNSAQMSLPSSSQSSNSLEIGILHTIFFHRFFPSLAPRSREVLDITLPFVEDAELDTMIEKRAAELARELDAERTHLHSSISNAPLYHLSQQRGGAATAAASNGGRGNISVQFFEKKRRKAWYMRAAYGSGDEEVCWECWTVKVTVAEPRTESERAKVRKAMEQTLLTTAMKIVTCVNSYKDHIPPITTSETNPFPYQINVNQKDAGWITRMGIY